MQDSSPKKPKTKQTARHKLPTGVLGIAAIPDSQSAIVGCVDGVYTLELESGASHKLYEHDSYVSNVVYQVETDTIVSSGYDGHIKWFQHTEKKLIRDVAAHRFWSWDMAMSPNGERIASVTGQYLAGSDRYAPRSESESSVKVFEAQSGEELLALKHVPSVQSVSIGADDSF